MMTTQEKEYHLIMAMSKLDIYNMAKTAIQTDNVDLNIQDIEGNTLLIYAVMNNDIEKVKLYLDQNKTIDENYINMENEENVEKQKIITDVNIANNDGKTALMIAYENNNKDIIQMLLQEKNINVNFTPVKSITSKIKKCAKKCLEHQNMILYIISLASYTYLSNKHK